MFLAEPPLETTSWPLAAPDAVRTAAAAGRAAP